MRVLILFLLALGCAYGQSLDPLLKDPALWETPREGFVEKDLGFVWLSQDVAQRKTGTLFSMPFALALARFESEKLSQLDVQIYNRGDMGELNKEAFQELLRKVVDALSAHSGVQGKPLGKDPTSAVRAEVVEWKSASSRYSLEYSFTSAGMLSLPMSLGSIKGPKAIA